MDSSWLFLHLLRDHGRTDPGFGGLPLEALHRLEHVEQELGLLVLGHSHAADGTGHRPTIPG
jgi:hypothetical protein